MITVFMEYRISPEKRSDYMRLMQSIAAEVSELGGQDYRFYEGIDQPNLFVETFAVPSYDHYLAFKKRRTTDERLVSCVSGGAEKVHIWAFAPQQIDKHEE